MKLPRLVLTLALVLLVGSAGAQVIVTPSQHDSSLNDYKVSAATTASVYTLAAVPNQQIHLYSIAGYCSAGSSSIAITVGGVTQWTSSADFFATTIASVVWIPPFTAPMNTAVVVTIDSCGTTHTSTSSIQADRY